MYVLFEEVGINHLFDGITTCSSGLFGYQSLLCSLFYRGHILGSIDALRWRVGHDMGLL